MSHEPDRKPISVEDLLRVKRAEKPNTEFWSSWQAEVRTKLKTADEQPRSWWSTSFPRIWISVARWHLPVGAAALAALVYVSVKEYRPVATSEVITPIAGGAEILQSVNVGQPATLLSELRDDKGKSDESSTLVSSDVLRSVVMLSSSDEVSASKLSRSARAIAANLAYLRSCDPMLSLGEYRVSLLPSAPIQEPLTKVATTHESKQNQIIASYSSLAASGGSSQRAQDRLLTRINDDQLYESAISRIGARGDRLSLKF